MIICEIIDTMLRIVKTKKNSLPFGPNSLKKSCPFEKVRN